MPFSDHWRLTFGGGLGAGAAPREIWSNTLNFAPFDGDHVGLDVDTNETAQMMVESIAAWMSRGTSKIASSATLRELRLAQVDASGHVVVLPNGTLAQTHLVFEAVAGGGGANIHPFQCTQVLSLLTARHGPTGKGRVYTPLPTSACDAAGQVPAADRDGVLASFRTLLLGLHGALQDTGHANWSTCVSSTKGYNTPVIAVRCGRVIDTHRSRRGELLEEYAQIML